MAGSRDPISNSPHLDRVDLDHFREAMSRLGASVSIVTTDGKMGRCGLTVTSVTSVSDDPPILLTCINHQSRTCDVLSGNGVFAVNVLAAGTEKLSDVFAGRHDCAYEDRFDHAEWHDASAGTGAPVLKDARVALDCDVVDWIDSGTHRVFFGQVVGIRLGQPKPALLYVDRDYREI